MFKELFMEGDTLQSLENQKVSLLAKALKLIPGSPKQLKVKAEIAEIFKKIEALNEKVSGDCSTGSGVVPGGPWNGYKIIRTSHLDEPRNPPSEIQRDHGVTCRYFDEIAKALFRKRPLGMKTGDYAIFWKNSKGVQNAMVRIDAEKKIITFVTMIQQSKPMNKYRVKSGTVKLDLGIVKEPK